MSLNLAGLSTYTDEARFDLISASLLKAKTAELITVQAGIKSSAPLNILSQDSIWTNGGTGGFTNSGTTSLTQRTITVYDIKKNEQLDVNVLEDYWTQTRMKAGSYNDALPFEQLYSEEVVKQTQKYIEQLTWRGNITTGSGNLSLANGFLSLMDGSSGVVTGSTGSLVLSAITDTVDEMVAAIPADMVDAEDQILFMGYDSYRTYAMALRDQNYFAYTGAENQGGNFEQMIPGTNIKVVGVGGLVGTGKIVLAEASNLVIGTDLMEDAESFFLGYDPFNDYVKLIQKFKFGVQMAFPERVVINA